MRVLLLRPPSPGIGGALAPPLGLAYVAAALRRAGHAVRIADGALPGGLRELRRLLDAWRPEAVGIGASTAELPAARRLLPALRARARWLLLGGPHPSAVGERVFDELPGLDLAVRGEGERAAVEALAWLEAGARGEPPAGVLVPGREGPPPRPIEELDALPWPARDLLPRGYRHPLSRSPRYATLLTSRGCPHACTFCDRSVHGRRWRGRDPEDVAREMAALERGGVGFVALYDDAFLEDRERVLALCNALERRGLGLQWKCEARVDQVDAELLAALRRAGCRLVAFGVESGRPESLRLLGKGFEPAQAERAFRLAREAGLETLAYCILGVPGETEEDVLGVLRWCRALRPDYVQFSSLGLYPGSALARRYAPRPGARNPFDEPGARPVATDLPPEVLARLLRRAWVGTYLRPAALGRLGRDLLRSGYWRELPRLAPALGRWLLAGP